MSKPVYKGIIYYTTMTRVVIIYLEIRNFCFNIKQDKKKNNDKIGK